MKDFYIKSVKPFLILTLLTITILWLVNKYTDKNIFKINGRKTGFIVLVLVLGSGLIVNAVFKDNFGRARPSAIIEFNGTQQFTPAFVISQECDRNCSFSSGHGSATFFTLALVLLFKNRRKAFAIAVTYDCLVSMARIAAGGNFFSGNVTSFFVMAITTDALYYILYARHKEKILE